MKHTIKVYRDDAGRTVTTIDGKIVARGRTLATAARRNVEFLARSFRIADHDVEVIDELDCTCPADVRGPEDCLHCTVHGKEAGRALEAEHASHRIKPRAQTWGNVPPHPPHTMYRAECSCGWTGHWHSYPENIDTRCPKTRRRTDTR